jgi:plasmid stability protein
MKTVPLTIRRCPEEVHQALKSRAKANKRSLNNEALLLLEQHTGRKPMTGKDLAEKLRELKRVLSAKELKEIAEHTEDLRKRMASEQ